MTPGKTQSLDVFRFSTFVFVPLSVWSMCSQPLPCLPITVGLFVLPAASYSAIKPKCFGNTAEHSAVSLWPPTSAPPLSSHSVRIALLPLEMELVHETNPRFHTLISLDEKCVCNLQAAYLNIQQARSDISIHFQLFVPQLCFRAGVANLYLQRLVGNCANVPASLSRLNYYIMLTNNHISPI